MKFLVFAAILVVGQATKLKIHVPKEAENLLSSFNVNDIPKKITLHLNGINPNDVLSLVQTHLPQVTAETEADDQVADAPAQPATAHLKVHLNAPVQEDAHKQKIKVHLKGANLNDIMKSLSKFAPSVVSGQDAPHIKIHLKNPTQEVQNDEPAQASQEQAHKIVVHLNGANLQDILPMVKNFAPMVQTGNDQPQHIKVHLKQASQKDAPAPADDGKQHIRLHLKGAGLQDVMTQLQKFAPMIAGGNDHIKIHLRPHLVEKDEKAETKEEESVEAVEEKPAEDAVQEVKADTDSDSAEDHQEKYKQMLDQLLKERADAEIEAKREALQKAAAMKHAMKREALINKLQARINARKDQQDSVAM